MCIQGTKHVVIHIKHDNFRVMKSSELTLLTGRIQSGTNNFRVLASIQHYVGRIIVHPQYNHTEGVNNTALLWLKKKLKYGDNVTPACLPLIGSKSDLNCSVGGYDGNGINMTLFIINLTVQG